MKIFEKDKKQKTRGRTAEVVGNRAGFVPINQTTTV